MTILSVSLNASPAQAARLRELQLAFTQVCNALAPIVRDTRCWNRVALHHMTYRSLRDQFPQMGSQMVCNAIYSVSRTCRVVYQAPGSPFNVARMGTRPLPLISFAVTAPVYFDRHTLSLKAGRLSMFTLDGRMHFDLNLRPGDEARFHDHKLLEIVLQSEADRFRLVFSFADPNGQATPEIETSDELPEYILVLPEAGPAQPAAAIALAAPAAGAPSGATP